MTKNLRFSILIAITTTAAISCAKLNYEDKLTPGQGASGTPVDLDSDDDGLTDTEEILTYHTDPKNPDTDGGGVNDGDEVNQGLNPLNAADDVVTSPQDSDNDGLTDEAEVQLGTNPNQADSDGDGLDDGLELNTTHTNPLAKDTDGGGVEDGQEVSQGLDPLNGADDHANLDTDKDGLTDAQEKLLGTSPTTADSDGDGLSDGSEVLTYHTSPTKADTDGGGVNDGQEIAQNNDPLNASDDVPPVNDTDKDGISDPDEVKLGTDPKNPDSDGDGLTDGAEVNVHHTDPKKADTDGGGVKDGLEVANGKNPLDPKDDQSTTDTDGDGLTDAQEAARGTNPTDADTDKDGLTDGAEVFTHNTDPLKADTDGGGINDGWEVGRGYNPKDPADDKTLLADADGDGLNGAEEINLGTDPNRGDTDGDGLKDGAEVNTHHTDPKKADTDGGGLNDGDEVKAGKNPLDPKDDQKCDESKKTLGLWMNPKNGKAEKDMTYMGPITAFKGSFSAKDNYNYTLDSANPRVGPKPKDRAFFAFLYEGKDGLGLTFYQGVEGAKAAHTLNAKIVSSGNNSADKIFISDEDNELKLQSNSSKKENTYTATYSCKDNTDGGAIGPFASKKFKVYFSINAQSGIDAMSFVSGDGKVHNLKSGNKAGYFAVGYKDDESCKD